MHPSQARGDAVRASTKLLPRIFAVSLGFLLFACHSAPDAPLAPPPPLQPEEAELDDSQSPMSAVILEPAMFAVASYEGSGQMVHPDAVVFPHSWQGKRYWFAATPYPFGDATYENPSSYAGSSPEEWATMPGATNPLARPDTAAYLSDPDLSYDPVRDELRLYYRQTTHSFDQIYVKTTRNGRDWTVPALVVQDARYSVISPAIVREPEGSWRMWSVGARDGGCRVRASAVTLLQRRSRDGLAWGVAEPVKLVIPGRVPWHWDVQYIKAKKEYWALVAAFPDGSNCSRSAVFFARSVDGTTWTVSPTPLLAAGQLDAVRDLVYRSTFRYFPTDDVVSVWFSGAREEDVSKFRYAMATARYPLADLLRRVEAPAVSASRVERGALEGDQARMSPARRAFVEAFP